MFYELLHNHSLTYWLLASILRVSYETIHIIRVCLFPGYIYCPLFRVYFRLLDIPMSIIHCNQFYKCMYYPQKWDVSKEVNDDRMNHHQNCLIFCFNFTPFKMLLLTFSKHRVQRQIFSSQPWFIFWKNVQSDKMRTNLKRICSIFCKERLPFLPSCYSYSWFESEYQTN